MKRFIITWYDENMFQIFRYPYYDYALGIIKLSKVLDVYRRLNIISLSEQEQLSNCKCVMIEEDN